MWGVCVCVSWESALSGALLIRGIVGPMSEAGVVRTSEPRWALRARISIVRCLGGEPVLGARAWQNPNQSPHQIRVLRAHFLIGGGG